MRGRFAVALLTVLWTGLAVAQDSVEPITNFGQELLSMRDPFRKPEIAAGETVQLSELELHPLHQFALVGVMTGPHRIRGMVRGPDGKTHFVSENDKIGNKRGFIKKITPKGLVVQEHVVNVLGEEEVTLTELKISDTEVK